MTLGGSGAGRVERVDSPMDFKVCHHVLYMEYVVIVCVMYIGVVIVSR